MAPPLCACPDASACCFDCIQPSFLVGLVSLCCSPTTPSLWLLVSSASQRVFGPSGLQSLLQAPTLRVGPAVSLQLDERSWNLYLQGYLPPPGFLPAVRPPLYHFKFLPSRCFSLYRGMDVVMPRGFTVALLHCPMVALGASSLLMHRRFGAYHVPG
jgi:hypothetical protein